MRRLLFLTAMSLAAQTSENVLLVINGNDAASREIAEYYRSRRSIPAKNVCVLATTSDEEIDRKTFESAVERPIADCLRKNLLQDTVLYLVTTLGLPLKISGAGSGMTAEYSSVDSELTILYGKLKGQKYALAGPLANPFFMRRDEPFRHPRFPIYLVTRLAGYDVNDVKGMIDRSLAAKNRGRYILDLDSPDDRDGNSWLRTAALLLPAGQAYLDETMKVVTLQKDVIGYASWGSNDKQRKIRDIGFQWLPGAIATEFVSTNARTFKRPPDSWSYTGWDDGAHYFGGSPQGLSADLIHQGATGASGNAYEPYLQTCVRPDYLFPAYHQGRNLAESFYLALPAVSWQGVILGDPLCSLAKP
jgi:uncharacterized protein (TIGR03790 family)